MTKTELAKSLADKFDLSGVKSNEIVDHIIDTITDSLVKNEPVAFVGFGTFTTKDRPERDGRNPSTGEPLKIPACKVVKFSVGKKLKEIVNKK